MFAAFGRRKGVGPFPPSTKKIVVVIPAHNESQMIAGTVTGVLSQSYPASLVSVFVIADNCSDTTAELARQAGARVLERFDRPGKGQALDTAFQLLLQEDADAFMVVDADTVLDPDTLAAVANALDQDAKVLQVRYGVLNPEESWRTAAMELALASFNALRPRGKAQIGVSAGLFGNGFCLSREALTRVPYLAGSVVEDLEYHLHLLRAGLKVQFLDGVSVKAQMPATAADSKSQRVRWERGRFGLVRNMAPALLKELLRGRLFAFEALIDVCILPVSLIGLSLIVPLLLGPWPFRWAALLGLAALAFHYGVAALRFGSMSRLVQVAFHVPWYVVWKCAALVASLFQQRNLPWIRTKRH